MPRFRIVSLLLVLHPVAAFAGETVASPAEEERLAGHSYHGESFNEGPRQAAALFRGNGAVHFPATCSSDEVQKFIDQGLGQLHGFWYFEAERSFRQAAAIDPDCGIAYWGMAMASRGNESRARGFIEEAVKRKESVTGRERMYIEALAGFLDEKAAEGDDGEKKRRQKLVKAYEEILHQFPDDIEARALLGLTLWENRSKGIPISSHFAVDALMNQVLAENPLHPVHHFRIHLWDYEKPERALDSAALCGESSPAIAHMWHMPGHTYSRLKRYHEAAWHQEASARVDHAYMMRQRVLPDRIHNFAHNNEWLIRNLVHVGRAADALDLAKNMIDLPRHPEYNTLKKRGSAKFGRMRLFETLATFEMWEELVLLARTRYLEPTEIKSEQVARLRHLGVARFRTGDVNGGCEILSDLKGALQQETEHQQSAAGKAEGEALKEEKTEEEIRQAGDRARRQFAARIRELQQAVHELEGHLHLADEAYDDALASLKKVNRLLNPGWLAEVQFLAGEREAALRAARKRAESNPNQVVPLAQLVTLLRQADERDEAKKAFEKLRTLAAAMDLDAPVFAPLRAIADELGLPEEWRPPLEYGNDFGERPDLATLGPFRWSPMPAEGWSLEDHNGVTHSLSDFKGKPVLVIFYLGHGCLHCAEQLHVFAPKAREFARAGISLIAVSTDTPTDLKRSHENYDDGPLPFPLVANAELDVFKRYRCHDDFEAQPLHGTFLIDAEGRVRWQDIGYEPFMDAGFVLAESKRLLSEERRIPEGETETRPAEAGSPPSR